MKILLVVPKYDLKFFPSDDITRPNYYYFFPLSLGYISAILKKAKYDVDCLNLNHYEGTVEELIRKKLDKRTYDVVCTGNTALEYASTEVIINSVRNHESKPKFILGGPIITSEPKIIFEDLKPDFAALECP